MIVIADDITGAAEIAGIAFARGEAVRLVCGCVTATYRTATYSTNETTVIATDTRSMSEPEAVAETRHIASSIIHHPSSIFKKTDSALRGHVVAELAALMQATGYERAVYLPANPSKGRVIRNGIYYINNVPIHETPFSYDPEFPAKTSVLKERFPDTEAHHIIMPDAESEEDIRNVIAEYNDGKTIFAGAADLFSAMIGMGCLAIDFFNRPHPMPIIQAQNSSLFESVALQSLILCGSTQSKTLDLGIPVAPMPQEIYDGSDDLSLWDVSAYSKQHSLILTIPHTHRTGKDVAVHLRTVMAEMTKRLVAQHCPEHLMIEGGATAWATLQALGWADFTITAQLAPGVVQMSAANGTLVTLKPGSYSWGSLFNKTDRYLR